MKSIEFGSNINFDELILILMKFGGLLVPMGRNTSMKFLTWVTSELKVTDHERPTFLPTLQDSNVDYSAVYSVRKQRLTSLHG